ncbi:hypothetical protein [Paraburkholderia oxyphila]|uniref:hypothetical protein n=1 Tax=Paraburkholderia oxyphila TaxID=614212 RepID=UPI0004880F12|nr:hypothetical protein [Paraburkholderia oxyphila]
MKAKFDPITESKMIQSGAFMSEREARDFTGLTDIDRFSDAINPLECDPPLACEPFPKPCAAFKRAAHYEDCEGCGKSVFYWHTADVKAWERNRHAS